MPEATWRSSEGQHSKFFLDKRYGKSMQKIFDGNYRLPTGIRSGFLSIKKRKGNLNMFLPPINPIADLRNIHPWVKSLLSARIVPNLPLAGRLKHFLEEWKILTKYPKNVRNFKKSNTGESFPDVKYGSGANSSDTSGNRDYVEQGSQQQTENQAGDFLSNIFDLR